MANPYAALSQLIDHLEAEPQVSPAGLHGLWCGRLSAGERVESPAGWTYTLKILGCSAESTPASLTEAFRRMREFAMGSLGQEDFSFELWLPDDGESCSTRLAALADWSRGYLEGLISVDGQVLETLSADSRELVDDIMQIGEVDTALEESEQDERELYELTEFVKVAVLNIHLEALQKQADDAQKRKLKDKGQQGPTLH